MNILLINGVNTAYGGSGRASLGVWIKSFLYSEFEVEILNSVPNYGIKKRGPLLYFILIIYFFPGVIFRIIKNPLSELLYKLSPFLFLDIAYKYIFNKYEFVIFSHHCTFIYSWIVQKEKRIYIIQDLLYCRAKSMRYSRKICKFIFKIECYIYKSAPNIVCVSYHESKILSKFLTSNIELTSCISNELINSSPHYENLPGRVAIVSDWRRSENLHGLLEFFSENSFLGEKINIEFWLYGISSSDALQLINGETKTLNCYKFYDGGTFENYDNIPTKFFLVPIYQGAGIKLKTLEMFSNGRHVLGTPAAFIGIPRYIIKKYSQVLSSPSDIVLKSSLNSFEIQSHFCSSLSTLFKPIGDIVKNISVRISN